MRWKRNLNSDTTPTKKDPYYSPVMIYGILTCGIILILVGIYLDLTDQVAFGIGMNRRNSGPAQIGGSSTIVMGMIICAFPLYYLYKKSKKRTG